VAATNSANARRIASGERFGARTICRVAGGGLFSYWSETMAEELKGLKVGWRYRYEANGAVVDIVKHDGDLTWLGSDGQSWGTYRMVELGPTPPEGYDLILDREAAAPKNVETDLVWHSARSTWAKPTRDDGELFDGDHYCRKIRHKIQVRDGGRYRTRGGKVVTMRPYLFSPDYPWRGGDGWTRTDSGQFWADGTKHPDDLVEELPIEEAVEETDEPIRIVVDGCRVLRGTEEIARVEKGSEIINVSDGNTSLSFTPDEWAAIIDAINKLRNQ